jgi:hypothetical protein
MEPQSAQKKLARKKFEILSTKLETDKRYRLQDARYRNIDSTVHHGS